MMMPMIITMVGITMVGITVVGIAVMIIAVMRAGLACFTIGPNIRFTRFAVGTNGCVPMITVASMATGWMMIQPDHESDHGKDTGRKNCTCSANARLLPAFAHVISEEENQHERTERKQDR